MYKLTEIDSWSFSTE